MRKTELLVASIPPAMMREVERLKEVEHRTRSELVRAALRTYFALAAKFPEEKPTTAEIRALREGRREYTRGETLPLEKVIRELPARTRKARTKAARATSAH
jgi:predicted transcriptional regulator